MPKKSSKKTPKKSAQKPKPAPKPPPLPGPAPPKKKSLALLIEGTLAPDFELQDASGKKWKLSDFGGKKVVLYFYPKDMTPGCTIEACDFRNHYKDIRKKGAIVLGVSADSPQSHKQFIDKHQLNFTLLSDADKKAIKSYGAWGEKSFLGVKFDGTHRITYVIDEKGKITKVFDKVNPLGHAKQVLEAL